MYLLFEYGEWQSIENEDALLQLLKNIWEQRKQSQQDFFNFTIEESEENLSDKKYQPFLRFSKNEIRANNYVGFIQNGDDLVEIYPKVFRDCNTTKDKNDMLRHIFLWFSYCRRWKFPFNQADLDDVHIENFPELIIHLIANQFLKVVSSQPLAMYQFLEETMQVPRGSINFKRYISNSLSSGNFQNIECDYEPFLFDNKVNRIIKYCSRLLMSQAKFPESSRVLQEIIFILDEVEDVSCNSYDVENVKLNSFFDEYNDILNNCKLILNQQLYSSDTYDLSQWCLLFPMEYIFEDFVAGFIEEKFSDNWKVEYQKSNKYLSDKPPKAFQMQHDIFLTSKNEDRRTVIIDTKYKLRSSNFKNDIKKGIAQIDLYQMISYAFKRGCKDIFLLYPNLTDKLNEPDIFEINSGFNKEDIIIVKAIEIPFWTQTVLNKKELENKLYSTLSSQFDKLKIGTF